MRLTKHEIDSVKKAFRDVFGEGAVWLFGSPVEYEKLAA